MLVLVGCAADDEADAPALGTTGAEAEDLACMLAADPFDAAALAADIEYLASDELAGRAPGTAGDDATLAFIVDRFRCTGLMPGNGNDTYRHRFETSEGDATANVVGILPGRDPQLANEVILVGAHHDHLGKKGKKIFNGANDNASGVAAVLASAQWLAAREQAPRRTIAFVTFGFEEHDGKCEGSEYFASRPPQRVPMDGIAYMVDLDMLGTYPSDGVLTTYGTYAGTLGRRLLVDALSTHADLEADLGRKPARNDSDFQAFCNAGIPYVYFETWDRSCYHAPCDDADVIDYPSYRSIAELSAELVLALADTNEDLMAAHGSAARACKGVD